MKAKVYFYLTLVLSFILLTQPVVAAKVVCPCRFDPAEFQAIAANMHSRFASCVLMNTLSPSSKQKRGVQDNLAKTDRVLTLSLIDMAVAQDPSYGALGSLMQSTKWGIMYSADELARDSGSRLKRMCSKNMMEALLGSNANKDSDKSETQPLTSYEQYQACANDLHQAALVIGASCQP